MTIKELKNRLKEIAVEAKAAETSGDDAKLDKLIEEANTINDKIERAQKLAEITKNATAAEENEGEQQESTPENLAEKRGKKLKNGETVRMNKTIVTPKAAISTTTIAMPHHTAEDVRDTFNDVSSLIDAVKIVPLDGGESYQRGFVKSYGEGDYTTEGSDAATAEPTFDYIDINKTYITAYAEEPNAIRKLAPAAYDAVISNSTSRAVRKKLSKQILVGSGETGSIVGIFNAPAKVIDPTTDMEVTAITGTTLDDIIYSYGGEEDVEGFCGLILNKADLKAFAKLRTDDGKKVYDIQNNGNSGTIDGVPFIINSACKAVSAPGTTKGEYCMAYGPFFNYELAVFSDMDVSISTEYKFKSGQIAHKAEMYVGGNTASYNGFVRVKKG
jgi:HK97 family phage major capsid protein